LPRPLNQPAPVAQIFAAHLHPQCHRVERFHAQNKFYKCELTPTESKVQDADIQPLILFRSPYLKLTSLNFDRFFHPESNTFQQYQS
jgi:hypothetical protein